MVESMIVYFGQQAKVACDGNCKKAWGMNSRPQKNQIYQTSVKE